MLSSNKVMPNQILYSPKYSKIFHKAQYENMHNSSKQQQARVVSKKYSARLNEFQWVICCNCNVSKIDVIWAPCFHIPVHAVFFISIFSSGSFWHLEFFFFNLMLLFLFGIKEIFLRRQTSVPYRLYLKHVSLYLKCRW